MLQVNGNKLGAHTGPEIGRNLSIKCFGVGKYSDLEETECTSQLDSLCKACLQQKL